MGVVQKRTFSLAAKQARFIDMQVRAGAYASASEVVRAGLRTLQERNAGFEDWLRSEVAPVYDAMKADPKRGIPAEKVFAELRARHAEAEGPKAWNLGSRPEWQLRENFLQLRLPRFVFLDQNSKPHHVGPVSEKLHLPASLPRDAHGAR